MGTQPYKGTCRLSGTLGLRRMLVTQVETPFKLSKHTVNMDFKSR